MNEGWAPPDCEFCGACYGHDPYCASIARAEVRRLRRQLVTAAQEALTNALHPEFGYEWREPNGVVYKAWAQGKAEGALERKKDDEVAFLLRGELPETGQEVLVTVFGKGDGELALKDAWGRWGPPQKLNPAE